MEIFGYAVFFFIGAMAASFAAVVAERLHTGEPWISGRSRCNSCGRTLTGLDLIPLVSWLAACGRCRACGSRVPMTYLLTEGATGLVFALGFHTLGFSLALIPFLLAVATLVFIVAYDLRHTVVPPQSSLLLVLLCLMAAYCSSDLVTLGTMLLTAGVIGLGFLALHVFSKGRAMGLADAPVAFALSVLAGPYAIAGLLFSFWIGAIWGIGMLVMRRGGPRMGIEVPFVPFLAVGYLVAYFVQWNPLALVY